MYIKKSIFDPSIREIESMTNSSDPSLLFPSPSFLICDGEFQTEDNKTGGQYMCYVSSRLCAVFFSFLKSGHHVSIESPLPLKLSVLYSLTFQIKY